MIPSHGVFWTVHFYLFGVLAVACALAFVTRRNLVAAALWLVSTMFCLAAMYVMMDAQFLGVIQVMIYAGAIMVVFLFVVMLLNLGGPDQVIDLRGAKAKLFAGIAGVLLLGDLLFGMLGRAQLPQTTPAAVPRADIVSVVAGPLFAANGFLLPFEVTSVLLLAAVVGAVVLAKRRV